MVEVVHACDLSPGDVVIHGVTKDAVTHVVEQAIVRRSDGVVWVHYTDETGVTYGIREEVRKVRDQPLDDASTT